LSGPFGTGPDGPILLSVWYNTATVGQHSRYPASRKLERMMPQFYFNIRKGDALLKDPEGAEFMSVDAARDEAIAAAREIMSEQIGRGEFPEPNSCFEINDDGGRLVLTVSFDEALAPKS
jgi:hypothetical protein